MNQPSYDLSSSEDKLHYEFMSVGTKGSILKVVEYTYLSGIDMWNFGFGDFDVTTGQISDSIVSNNGDGRKVIITVAKTLLDFFVHHPNQTVIFTGSDERRTLIYKRIIFQYYAESSDRLLITGLNAEGAEQSIEPNVDYIAFIVRQK